MASRSPLRGPGRAAGWTWLVGAACALLPLAPAAAQPGGAPAAGRGLSLEEARRLADARAPAVLLAQDRVREAEATRVGAGIVMPVNPRVQGDYRPGLDATSRGSHGYAAAFEALFEVAGAPGARITEAERRAGAARAEAEVVRLEARLGVTASYVSAQLAERRRVQAEQAIALADRLLEAARERVSAGAGTDIEVTSMRAERAERQAERHAADAELVRHATELRYLLALPAEEALTLTSPPDDVAPAPPVEALTARARQSRPDFVALERRLDLLAATDVRLKKEARPRAGVYGGVDAAPQSPLFGLIGLSFELPVAQRNQGPRAVVAAERRTELDRYELLRRETALGLHAARTAHEARRAELEVLTREALPAAEERLRLVEIGWRAGRFDVFRVTAAAQDLVRLRAKRLDVIERLWAERLRLERLVGAAPALP
jgi:cobalt-zinc-cadmium efflux system outer membrane protein